MKGSSGVWGKIPMIPHSHHTADEVREMVGWIYSLEPAALARVFTGFAGTVPADAAAGSGGRLRLEATYLDRGAGEIPPLAASATIHLRSRRCEAEGADEIRGPATLASANAGGGKFLGAIDHGHAVRFADVPLDGVSGITLALASAGAGGGVEIRRDAPDGPLLATVPIEVNGHWEQFYERTATWDRVEGRHDVWIVFTHPGRAGGLGNLDSVRWLP